MRLFVRFCVTIFAALSNPYSSLALHLHSASSLQTAKHLFGYALVVIMLVLMAQERYTQPRQASTPNEQEKGKAQPESTPVNNPSPKIDEAAEAARKREQQDRDAKEETFKSQQLKQNGIMVWATVGMAICAVLNLIVAVAYVVYAGKTLRAIKEQSGHAGKQVEAMEKQGTSIQGQLDAITRQEGYIRTQAEAAQKAAEMAMGQLVAMQSQERAQYEGLEETRKIVGQNERTIETTQRSVDIAEKNSIYAQRAYVVAKMKDVGLRDSSLQFRFRIQNGGSTPANNVCVTYECSLRDSPPWSVYDLEVAGKTEKQVVFDVPSSLSERLGVIAPHGSYEVLTTPETYFQSTEQFDGFGNNELKFYCWGRIIYEDIFNTPRHTDFCFYQSQSRPDGYPCEYGNEAI